MNILEKIVVTKKEELALAKQQHPLETLKDAAHYHRQTISTVARLRSGTTAGVITEFKRRSPSKGWINEHAVLAEVVQGYAKNGAAAISVLTDVDYFGGSLDDLRKARSLVEVPLLRKDFTIDGYQLHEAKAAGADLILLIAAILSPIQVQELTDEAHSLGLEVLLELHDEAELAHVYDEVDMVGINNRNLKNFEVNIEQSIRLQSQLPKHILRVAESGIHSAKVAQSLLQNGFEALLMGEYFMKQAEPDMAFASFVNQLKTVQPSG